MLMVELIIRIFLILDQSINALKSSFYHDIICMLILKDIL